MNTTEIPLDERIRTFAESVRAHLDDLPGDEVDDIIIGLVADLADQAADGEGELELDDPAAYAAELRSAAGLPDRAESVKRDPLRVRIAARRRAWNDSIRRSAFGAWLLDLLVALRPVWWVLRGLGMFAVASVMLGFYSSGTGGWFLPESPWEWIVMLVLVLVSVQWGRDHWLPKNALRYMRTVVSIIAVIMLPFVLGSIVTPRVEWVSEDVYEQPGLLLDGVQVGNVFAYDANGELIDGVQLYTDKGTPLNLFGGTIEDTGDDGWYGFGWNGEDTVRVPFQDTRDSDVWNIYPLREARVDPNTGKIRSATIKDATAPFVRAPGLLAPSPAPTEPPADEGDQTPEP